MLFSSLIVYLIYNSINIRCDKTILFSRITAIILIYCALIPYNNLNMNLLNTNIGLFNGLLHVNSIIYIFQIFIILLSIIIVGLTCYYPRKIWTINNSSLYKLIFFKLAYKYKTIIINKMSEQFNILEYSLILLFTISGALLLITCSDLVSIFLCIELQSYGLYLISTIYRNSEWSTSAGLTYFLLGGLSSCFILLGSAYIYINSGTTSLDNFYIVNSISDSLICDNSIYKSYYIPISFIIITTGLLFKVSAAPFHFWSPDVYDWIPTIVTTFVAIIAKISILIILLQLIHYSYKSLLEFNWTIILLISSFLSLIVGSVLGLIQNRIKKLYAYSTISHIGFMLLSLNIYNSESIQAFIFYIMQYSISNLNAFILLLVIGYFYYIYYNDTEISRDMKDVNNSPIQKISQLKGLFYLNPFLSLSFSITLFSFMGIPPLMGFFAKQMVLSSAINNDYVFMSMIAIITSVISAVYYLLIIKNIFFNKSDYKIVPFLKNYVFVGKLYNYNSKNIVKFTYKNIKISSYFTIIISILTLVLITALSINNYLINMGSILSLTIYCT